jgi:predicted GNAT family acetyltransferase
MPDLTEQPASLEPDDIEVRDNPERSRYEARRGEQVLGIVDYTVSPDGAVVLVHTEVMPEAKGMGVGTRLAKGSLEDVRARGVGLRIQCPFIAAYVKRHRDEYADLVDR